ncbi:histidine phosphatase family protein [Solicola gregarius]|uniref:Histidine phosphatase family protein n=1 Tax=Solicola gregarius TaxID=2908642 RepID=A0AA46TGX9_9ACTN|nr:histidine phosphatase family protein [Solicola gregarius]UYM04328.1 histidine phosphatase family protein [Solicola gregarius]
MGRQLILWRHGRTAWNATGRVQGQTDIPLDEVGMSQAASAAARLASLRPDRIVSSDLSRAYVTAQALAAFADLDVEVDQRLREINFGAREGLTMPEAKAAFPTEMRRWLAGEDIAMEGAETYAQTARRVAAAIRDAVDSMGDESTVVLVAHGAAIRVGTCEFLGLPQEHWRSLGGFNNCAWAVLQDGRHGWRIAEWNAGQLPEPVLSDETQDANA